MKPRWLPSNGQTEVSLPEEHSGILLIEGDDDLRESRRLLLSCIDSAVRVVDFRSAGQLSALCGLRLVVISVSGSFETEHAAFQARRQWPQAKILLIGASCGGLDHALYDEIIDPYCNPVGFVEICRRLISQACDCSTFGTASASPKAVDL